MRKCFRFYVDDSGSPNPDHITKPQNHSLDWFALGGILIDEALQEQAEAEISAFRKRWPQIGEAPLHSYDIRNRSGAFHWMEEDAEARARFIKDLTDLMVELPYYALAGVVHRPGYNERYQGKYGKSRWMMCRTAFTIGVERAAKFARYNGARLRVYVERSDKRRETVLRGYYQDMASNGLPFSDNSAKYAPMSASELQETLVEFQFKPKQSALMQIADLALWPVCQGGYDRDHRPYRVLRKQGKLLDAVCHAENGLHGVKYSCFDGVESKKQKPPA